MDYKKVTSCRVCENKKLRKYLDLGNVPPVNGIVSNPLKKVKKYPLQLLFCDYCGLSQLSIVVSPKVLYRNYPYRSSISETFRLHCKKMVQDLLPLIVRAERTVNQTLLTEEQFDKKWFPKIIDIGANDGTLLREFRATGRDMALSAIDPCSKDDGKTPSERQYTVIPEFWSEKLAHKLNESQYFRPLWKSSIITAQNVVAHVDDIYDFMGGFKYLLDAKGVVVIEVPYLVNLIEKNQFDTVYHEHLSYFLVKPMRIALFRSGLRLFRVEEHPIHGGSLRLYACIDSRPVEASVWRTEGVEERKGFYDFKTYKNYAKKVAGIRRHFRYAIRILNKLGKKVIGYGASAKGAIFLNYCGMTKNDIPAIVDDTPEKQGKFQPGTGIPIVRNEMDKDRPDYILVLAWNFLSEMIEKTKKYGADYLVGIPEVKAIENKQNTMPFDGEMWEKT